MQKQNLSFSVPTHLNAFCSDCTVFITGNGRERETYSFQFYFKGMLQWVRLRGEFCLLYPPISFGKSSSQTKESFYRATTWKRRKVLEKKEKIETTTCLGMCGCHLPGGNRTLTSVFCLVHLRNPKEESYLTYRLK